MTAIGQWNGVVLSSFNKTRSPGCRLGDVLCQCTFFISRLSVVVLTSVVGQLDSSCDDLCGPFHRAVDVGSVEGSIPLEMRSPGLDSHGMCLHIDEDVSS